MNNKIIVLRFDNKAKIALASVLMAAALFFGYRSDWFQKNFLYPCPYQSIISEYALRQHIDPMLVAGVIYSESKFKPDAKSVKGAVGLMQLMPSTAEWIAEQLDEENVTPARLCEPELNIRFGTWYLASLASEFNGNPVLMLAAYNAGRGNVKEWMKKYNWDGEFADIGQIPFAETRQYVAKVLKTWFIYQQLYDGL